MLFCSYVFILLFLPLTVIGYFVFNRFNTVWARGYLLLASLVFYGYFNIAYLILLAGSLLFNYFWGCILYRNKNKILLGCGIAANILLLGYCKYYDFFATNINILFQTDIVLKNMLLPLGISFFTFQQISYLSDVYNGALKEKYSPLTYALFVTFFPQLVAGPIVLANEMMPQFAKAENCRPNYHNISCGIFIFSLGLAKKILLSDEFALIADAVFDLSAPAFIDSVLGSLAYTLQIYFDFSGYCDMAIGIGLMFNIVLPVNFSSPYRSADIQEFWRRWHITLGRFLSQFVYFPLGGSRCGRIRTYLNLLLTFLISGLWHGACWMMVLWGGLHGIAMAVHRFWSKDLKCKMPRLPGQILTFLFVWMAWILFRSESLQQARNIFCGFGRFSVPSAEAATKYFSSETILLFVAAAVIIFFLPPANSFKDKFKPAVWNLVVAVILIVSCVFSFNKISPFIYFNF